MKKVMIDIGHGGSDTGAVGNGLVEKDLNLKVGFKIRDILKNYDVEIRMTREIDKYLDTDTRVGMVNEFNPDLCVSIHHNAASASARGAEVIHAYYDKYDDKLALDILNRLAQVGMPTRRAFSKLNNRGSDWYYMIRRIWDNDTQAIITEGGFITNSEDAKLLKTESYLDAQAGAIAGAIIMHLDLKLKALKSNIPNWQKEAFENLVNKGIINTPDYWEGRLKENISIGEMMAVINNIS